MGTVNIARLGGDVVVPSLIRFLGAGNTAFLTGTLINETPGRKSHVCREHDMSEED